MATPQVSSDSGGLDALLKLFTAANQASGSGKTTTTTSGNPDDEAATTALLQQIMGSGTPDQTQGLVTNILNQAKTAFGPALFQGSQAGSYNSSALQQMQNDAVAKATAAATQAQLDFQAKSQDSASRLAAAKLAANKTQTSVTGVTPLGGLISKISPALGLYSGYKTLTKKGGLLDDAKDFFGQNSNPLSGIGTTGGGDLGSGALPSSVDSSGATSDVGFSAFGDSTLDAATGLSFNAGADLSAAVPVSSDIVGSNSVTAGQLFGAEDALDAGLVGGGVGEFGLDAAGTAALADASAASAAEFGATAAIGTAAEAEGFGETAAVAIALWVICTEAVAQKLMSEKLYQLEAPMVIKRLSQTTLDGYHVMAVPAVKLMRKNRLIARFLSHGANQYANWIVFMRPSIFGLLLRTVGEALCWTVGLVANWAKKVPDWKQLYPREVV